MEPAPTESPLRRGGWSQVALAASRNSDGGQGECLGGMHRTLQSQAPKRLSWKKSREEIALGWARLSITVSIFPSLRSLTEFMITGEDGSWGGGNRAKKEKAEVQKQAVEFKAGNALLILTKLSKVKHTVLFRTIPYCYSYALAMLPLLINQQEGCCEPGRIYGFIPKEETCARTVDTAESNIPKAARSPGNGREKARFAQEEAAGSLGGNHTSLHVALAKSSYARRAHSLHSWVFFP